MINIEYALFCTWKEIRRNKIIAIFIIVQIAIGTAAFTYSENVYYSLTKEANSREHAVHDLSLDIFTDDDTYRGNPPITEADIKAIQDICSNAAFVFIAIPQFYPYNESFAEFNLLITDYDSLSLSDECAYMGEEITTYKDVIRQIIPGELGVVRTPESVNEAFEDEEGELLSSSVIIPVEYLDDFSEGIDPAGVHIELNSRELRNPQETVKQVEDYLNKVHAGVYRYQIASPNAELQSYRSKVDLSVNTIKYGSIIFQLICALGQISALQILFSRRERTYGTFLCCGSTKSQLGMQLIIEIGIINLLGVSIGCIAGVMSILNLDLGILPYGINNDLCVETFIVETGVAAATALINLVVLYGRLKKNDVLTLLRA